MKTLNFIYAQCKSVTLPRHRMKLSYVISLNNFLEEKDKYFLQKCYRVAAPVVISFNNIKVNRNLIDNPGMIILTR